MRATEKGTEVIVEDEPIAFRLQENVRQVMKESEYSWRDYEIEYEPTGRLYLEIESWSPGRSKWADGKKQRVENVLGSFVEGLGRAAAARRDWRVEQEKRERIWREEERKRRVQRERVKQLETWLSSWEQAERVRRFVAAAQREIADAPATPPETTDFLMWAAGYADHLDPLCSA